MKNNYTIITDDTELKKFIKWLPELKENETYYCCLFARSKYCKDIKHIKSDKAQLKRFTSSKGRLFHKIKQLECEIGSYTQRASGNNIDIPQEALAMYITINPRDMFKATSEGAKKLMDLALSGNSGFNPHQEILSEIQKAKGTKYFIDLDFDVRDEFRKKCILKEISSILLPNEYTILDTRGGFHILIHLKNIRESISKIWYKQITSIPECDICGDNMIPIPGTYQGGFTPKIYLI